MSRKVFLSCVTREFGPYRDLLAGDLRMPGVEVRVQEDFIVGGHTLLDKLDDYIKDCDAVVHLVGSAAGWVPQPGEVAELLARHPDLLDRVSYLKGTQLETLSYTQWEAWLAIYYQVACYVFLAEPRAPRAATFVADAGQMQMQERHWQLLLERLLALGLDRVTFRDEQHLYRLVLRSLNIKPLDAAVNSRPPPPASREDSAVVFMKLEPHGSPQFDENVQFTVYRPRTIQPEKWYDLLAFAHLAEKRADAPADEPDPFAEVQRQAKLLLGDKAMDYTNLTQDSLQAVPKQSEITFLPEVAGIEFNPRRRTFTWQESVHRQDFRLRAAATLDGTAARGKLSIFLGAILLGDVPLVLKVDWSHQAAQATEPLVPVAAHRYRKIFASYSHKDLLIVEQFEIYAAAIGDTYLRDWKNLRAGEVWSEQLRRLIEDADIFQLFWSCNSMRSDFVRQEWEYALELAAGRPNFVRPTYWENPMPSCESPRLPPEPLARLHFQHLGRRPILQAEGVPQAEATGDDPKTQDIFESRFDIPALQQGGAEGSVTVDTELESSDYDIDLDDSELADDAESGSQVVALDDEEIEPVDEDEVEINIEEDGEFGDLEAAEDADLDEVDDTRTARSEVRDRPRYSNMSAARRQPTLLGRMVRAVQLVLLAAVLFWFAILLLTVFAPGTLQACLDYIQRLRGIR